MLKIKRSFTLIEMLIVIVIIGILAAALVPRLQSIQGRARDTERKADLRSIYNANEIFLIDNGVYAAARHCGYDVSCGTWSLLDPVTGTWIPMLSGYIGAIPRDPINNGVSASIMSVTGSYGYLYVNVLTVNSGYRVNTYDLITQLENPNDPDRCGIKLYKYYYTPQDYCVFFPYRSRVYDYSPHNGVM